MATAPTINGQTFAQASAGITDRAELGQLASQFQSVGANNNSSITSANLQNNAAYTLPDAVTPTYGGVQGAAEAVATQAKTADEQARDQAQKDTDTSLQMYMKELLDSGNISSSVDRSEQDKAKKESDKYTSMLEQEALSNRRAIEQVQKNMTGALAGGVAIESERLNRESLSKQADIAILQTAANRNYDTAASIADRQVALKLEKSAANLSALKFFYETNKANFDKKDDRLYSEAVKKADREYKKEEDLLNDIKEIKLQAVQNGAGLDTITRIGQAKTLDQALQAAGRYAITIDTKLKQAQLAKLNEAKNATVEASDMDKDSDFKKLKGNYELKNKLTAYQKLVDTYGAQRKGRKNAAVLDNAYQEVLQAYRASKDLGALQGADLQLVDDAIKRATFEKSGFGQIINGVLLGVPTAIKKGTVKRGAEASISEAFNSIDRATKQLNTVISTKNPTWVNTPYYQTISGATSASPFRVDESGNIVIDGLEVTNEEFFK